jgi:CheY-like chemotaxis protein
LHWLIAEDETDIRNLVVMMTQVWGHTPMPFETGQKAWDWLDEVESGAYSGELPGFALMDIRMPGKRGYEISQRMRTIDTLKNIPIILMTAFVMTEDEMEGIRKKHGVDRVINKPLPDFDQLKKTIDDVIAGKKNDDVPAGKKNDDVPAGKKNDDVPAGKKNDDVIAGKKNG